jgi:hypothetical protein
MVRAVLDAAGSGTKKEAGIDRWYGTGLFSKLI